MKDDKLYLIHISECISRVKQYTSEGEELFFSDTKTQDAVLRNLQTMSESTQRLSEALKLQHADVDWHRISGFPAFATCSFMTTWASISSASGKS